MTEPATERTVMTNDGVSLWVRDTGEPDRPAVLCLHGGPGVGDYLEPVEEALSPAFRVIRFDQRGSGRSDPTGPFTIDRFIADIEAVADAVDLERFVLFGHSWGANLAMHHVQAKPGRTAGVVYVSGTGVEWSPGFSMLHKEYQVRRMGTDAGARLAQLRAVTDRTPEQDRELRLLYIRSELHDTEDTDTAERIYAAERALPASPEANAALNDEVRRRSLEQQIIGLTQVRCPVLVLHGASDPRPIDALASMIATLRSVDVEIVPAAGHSPWLDQPDLLWDRVRGFVAANLT